jgi:putative oxidoreductase
LLTTQPNIAFVILRIGLAIIMFAHGAQKLMGWFDGHGPLWTVEMWEKWFGLPPLLTWMVILGEFFAPLLLLVGFLTRAMSAILLMIMTGAVYLVHYRWGFYMNWYNSQERGEGFEFHILIAAVCLALMVSGSGKWSVDSLLAQKFRTVR